MPGELREASPIQFGRLTDTKWLVSIWMPVKGTEHRYCCDSLSQQLQLAGEPRLITRLDGEQAILDSKHAAMRRAHVELGLSVALEEKPTRRQCKRRTSRGSCEDLGKSKSSNSSACCGAFALDTHWSYTSILAVDVPPRSSINLPSSP